MCWPIKYLVCCRQIARTSLECSVDVWAAAAPAPAPSGTEAQARLDNKQCLGSAGTFMTSSCTDGMAHMLNVSDATVGGVADSATALHDACAAFVAEVCPNPSFGTQSVRRAQDG